MLESFFSADGLHRFLMHGDHFSGIDHVKVHARGGGVASQFLTELVFRPHQQNFDAGIMPGGQ
jgi:hypothetical protein